jgi:hypothetical protein
MKSDPRKNSRAKFQYAGAEALVGRSEGRAFAGYNPVLLAIHRDS